MGRLTVLGFSLLLLCAPAFAQRGIYGSGGARGGGYGYGNVISPGGAAPAGTGFGHGNILFPGGVTAFPGGISNPPINPRVPPLTGGYTWPPSAPGIGVQRGSYRQRTVVVPYAIPVWGGGYGYWGADYPQQQAATNVTVVVPQQPAPQVIINQNYVPPTARPEMRDYSSADLPETTVESGGLRIYDAPAGGRGVPEEAKPAAPARQAPVSRPPRDDKPTIYFIALKDSTLRAALGYWSEGGLLKYVSPQGTINHVSLNMLDEETTRTVNRQQGLEWELHAK